MDLFGQNILDFPSTDDTLFLGRLPRISESEYLQDLGLDNLSDNTSEENITENSKVSLDNDEEWSNDSASYSGDTNSETMSLEQKRILAFKGLNERPAVSPATENAWVRRSEVKRNVQSQLGDDDSYLYSVVSSDQIVRSSLRGMPPERDKMLVALKIETDMVKLVQGMGCSSKLGKFISFKNFFLFCFFASLSLSCLLILGIHSSLPLTRLNASLCGSSIMIPEIRSLSPSRSSILRNVNIGDSKSCTSLSSWVSMSTVTSWSPMSLTMSPAWE